MKKLDALRTRGTIATVAMACCALAACAAVGAAPAAAKPATKKAKKTAGHLDPKFGKRGKVTVAFPAGNTGSAGPQYTLPFSFTPGHLEMAKAPGGKTVVAGATKIVRFLANGKLDKSFGSGGVVMVPRPAGAVFVLASAAVDSAGRVVLAGLTRPVPPNSTPDPVLSSAEVMRFNADGSPDASFGSGGTLVTNFNLPAPKAAGGKYPGTSVGIASLAIDSQNRIVLSGGVVTELASCSRSVNSEGFVTRLTENGAVDPTFGFHLVEGLARLGQIEPRPVGYLALASGGPVCTGKEGPDSVAIGIDPNGNVDSGFASFGFRTVDFVFPPAMAVTPRGKILLMDSRPYRMTVGKGKKSHRVRVQTIERLLPSGAADPGFRRIGRVNVFLPKGGSLSTLAVDRKGRIIVAGRLRKRLSKPKSKLRRSLFLVSRLKANGSTDRAFGHHGSLTTSFGAPTDSFATQVLPAGNRILVGGGISGPEFGSGGGYAIARYLGG
jgi:uncharacterized delta-60 repeat protein